MTDRSMRVLSEQQLSLYFEEDDLFRNAFYSQQLSSDLCLCKLNIKSDLLLAGLPYFIDVFNYLGAKLDFTNFRKYEGKKFKKGEIIEFNLTFAQALMGERIALNLLQRASSIATYSAQFVEKAKKSGIKILDTRKTLPGHRSIEKYAVRMGGACNHRLGQTDVWMIKDNHKSFFGGIAPAVEFFRGQQAFYVPIEVEVHSISELTEALGLNVNIIMLDNFSPTMIAQAVDLKTPGILYEVSGGINLANIDQYLIKGIDAISIGQLTYGAPFVDLSLKFTRTQS